MRFCISQSKDRTDRISIMKDNFVYTVIALILISIGMIAYYVIYVPPTDLLIAVVLGLIFIIITFLISLIFMLFVKPKGFLQTKKTIFRKGIRFGLIFAAIFIILLILQIKLDLI